MLKQPKMLAAGGGVLVLLVTALAYFFVLGGSGATEEGAEGAEGDALSEQPAPVYVEGKLGPHITLPDRVYTLVGPPETPRYAKLQIVLEFETSDPTWFEISGEALAERLQEFGEELPLALIEDAVTTAVSTKSVEEISSTAGKDSLREDIRSALAELIPEHQVRRVLFVSFITQ